MSTKEQHAKVALVTGVSRKIGIGASIARTMAAAGWDVGMTYWLDYDAGMPWGSDPRDSADIGHDLRGHGRRTISLEADLSDPKAAARVFDHVESGLGPISALILCHCHSVDSDIEDTTIDSFDRHFAVNARATWLLIREFGRRFKGIFGSGRIVSLTSDHTAGNLPYGASKGAMDRIVLAASEEFRELGVTANVINPGATDTGWMSPAELSSLAASSPLRRVGLPQDCASLVRFLCSDEGGWINGQLLHSNGGPA